MRPLAELREDVRRAHDLLDRVEDELLAEREKRNDADVAVRRKAVLWGPGFAALYRVSEARRRAATADRELWKEQDPREQRRKPLRRKRKREKVGKKS